MGLLSGIQRLYQRQPEPDYETILSALEAKVKDRESHLLSIKLRERRANALFITYGLGAWLVYAILWWFLLLDRKHGIERLLYALPIVAGPVFIVFTRRIMRSFYHRKEESEEKSLRALKKEQRERVEELKRKTGYYSTRNLIEKYDDTVKQKAEARIVKPAGLNAPKAPQIPSKTSAPGSVPFPPGTPQQQRGAPTPFGTPAGAPLLPPAPSTPQPRTLMDKVADALLGVNTDESSPNSKYALICAKCFAHNGLVPKEEFDVIQYQCPRCGDFNPRRKDGGLTAAGASGSGHRRRVQSVHVMGSGLRDELELKDTPAEEGDDDGEEEGERDPVLLPEAGSKRASDARIRRRAGQGATKKHSDDEMDTDP